MDAQEFESQYRKLVEDFEMAKSSLCREYAFSNNPVKIGDKVMSRSDTIIVDEVKFVPLRDGGLPLPYCSYWGRLLTKEGKLRKDGKRCRITQMEML